MTIQKRTTEVFCTLQVEGIHFWANCPLDEVAYLRLPHRHVFHIKAYKTVTHADRDVEFIVLKHAIQKYLKAQYFEDGDDRPAFANFNIHTFGGRSCEMIAEELISKFNLSRCEVNEDGENGAIVTVEDVKEAVINIHNDVQTAYDIDFRGMNPIDVLKTQDDLNAMQAHGAVHRVECTVCGAGPDEPCATQNPCNACDAELPC